MDPEYEQIYHEIEAAHWWFRARRELVASQVKSLALPSEELRILDVGCSGGVLMEMLGNSGYTGVCGIDLSAAAVRQARRRGLDRAAVMDAASLAFDDQSFDLLVASDVLEHIEDEGGALREWRRVLAPGGWLLVYVPAFRSLWSPHDEVNRHFRRYRAGELRARLNEAGFDVARTGYWNALLFAPVWVARRLRSRGSSTPAGGDLTPSPAPVNLALLSLLRFENAAIRTGLRWPVGISVYAIAQRGSD